MHVCGVITKKSFTLLVIQTQNHTSWREQHLYLIKMITHRSLTLNPECQYNTGDFLPQSEHQYHQFSFPCKQQNRDLAIFVWTTNNDKKQSYHPLYMHAGQTIIITIIIIILRLDYSCLSVRNGRLAETIWPHDIRGYISSCWALEARTGNLCEHQSWH